MLFSRLKKNADNIMDRTLLQKTFSLRNLLLQVLFYDVLLHCSLVPIIFRDIGNPQVWCAVLGHTLMLVIYLSTTFVFMRQPFALKYKVIAIFGAVLLTAYPLSMLIVAIQNAIVPGFGVIYSTFSMCLVVATISAMSSLIIYILTERVEEKRNMQLVEEESIRNRYEALKQQLSPHFIFNTFNAINNLVGSDDRAAKESIQSLSSILRYTIDNKEEVSFADEMAFVRDYVALQQLRFDRNLAVEIRCDSRYGLYKLPPVSVQLLVENAIHHNIISKKHPLTIEICTTDHNSVIVSNPLQPRENEEGHTGIGLVNLNERYRLFWGEEIQIKKNDQTFSVEIPLVKP